MSTELLPCDDQLVAHFPTHNRDDHFLTYHIIQNSKVACPQFILGNGVRRSRFTARVSVLG